MHSLGSIILFGVFLFQPIVFHKYMLLFLTEIIMSAFQPTTIFFKLFQPKMLSVSNRSQNNRLCTRTVGLLA